MIIEDKNTHNVSEIEPASLQALEDQPLEIIFDDSSFESQDVETEIISEISIEASSASAEVGEDTLDMSSNHELPPLPDHQKDVDDASAIDLAEIARMVPDKMAFKIGEVADIAGVKTYVLRYWETEFDALNPQKSAFNQRMYSRKDVETVLLIKKLLYDEKFSIAGAKRKIKELRKELKAEKQLIDFSDRIETTSLRLEEMLDEIQSLKVLFT